VVNAPRVVLAVAGSDSSGGAGLAADIKTIAAHGLWPAVAVTAVTAQNTLGVQTLEMVSPELVRAQIASVVSDLPVRAAKTGMLGSPDVVAAVAKVIVELGVRPLVVDPVMMTGRGQRLSPSGGPAGPDPELVEAIVALLIPLADVLTPNLAEAAALSGLSVSTRADMVSAGRILIGLGARIVLVKGGHLGGDSSPDCLVAEQGEAIWLDAPRLAAPHDHGTGCVLSAAVASELAQGTDAIEAVAAAKRFVTEAIAAGVAMGEGVGPVDPCWGATSLGAQTEGAQTEGDCVR